MTRPSDRAREVLGERIEEEEGRRAGRVGSLELESSGWPVHALSPIRGPLRACFGSTIPFEMGPI